MSRIITVGAAQLGPIQRAESRSSVVSRMLALMDKAHGRGVELIVYPELALTTFFPRWMMEDQAEVDAWFEREMPNDATAPLFEAKLVITGEGQLDAQTAYGKAVAYVAALAREADTPCLAVAGSVVATPETISDAEAAAPAGMPLDEAISRAAELVAAAAERVVGRYAAGLGGG